MTSFSIVELSEITDVEVHVLLYWEESGDLIHPKKDLNGRKLYSQEDLKVFLRLRYLVKEKKFTIEGAYNQIRCEKLGLVKENTDEIHSEIKKIRDDLLEIYYLIKKYGKNKDEQ